MPRYTPEQIYAAASALLPELDEPLKGQVQSLLTQAANGQPADLQLLDLLSQDDALRQRLRRLLQAEETTREATLGDYSSLGGETYSTKAGDVFACPECGYRFVIGEDGEQPLPCEKHPRVRLSKEQ